MLSLFETMTYQGPEVARVMAKIEEDLAQTMEALDGGPWTVKSHSVSIYDGLIIASILVHPSVPDASTVQPQGLQKWRPTPAVISHRRGSVHKGVPRCWR